MKVVLFCCGLGNTFQDKISFDRMEARGTSPWKVWRDQPTPTVDSGT